MSQKIEQARTWIRQRQKSDERINGVFDTLGKLMYLEELLSDYALASHAPSDQQKGLLLATKLVCGYCADEESWQPAKKGLTVSEMYPEWWHLSALGLNVRNSCSAWAIHDKLESLPSEAAAQPMCSHTISAQTAQNTTEYQPAPAFEIEHNDH